MSNETIADFLRKHVYPDLDAVSKRLLEGLQPKQKTRSGSYPLTCPKCKSPEAFYYPNTAFINCPRKRECGVATSIWDALLYCNYAHSEILGVLCEAVGVEPPKRDQSSSSATPTSAETKIGTAILKITQMLARRHPEALEAFQSERGYDDGQMKQMRLGYYTTPQEVLAELSNFGFTSDDAAKHGYIERDENDSSKIWSGMAGKIIGYWLHPDGHVRLWGRLPTGSGDKRNPKYKFSPTLKKDIPYLFNKRQQSMLICVEGTMDAWALQLCGIWGSGIGGSSVNAAQAIYMCGQGISEFAHMVDGDQAGWLGAIGTIKACESLGIVTNVIPLGQGMDDPDALLRAGKTEAITALVESRMNSGHYLALMLSALYAEEPLNLRSINKVFAASEVLTPHSRRVFSKYSSLFGERVDIEDEAARIYSGLIKSDIGHKEASSIVLRRTGCSVSIQKEPTNG
tara:strand:+ start:33016 stop:34386 length:1371 start_codon:yes stop_codon:yes gene_type:complete